MKTLSVVGARPQFVKAAVVSAALAAEGIREILIHTGQHYDREMSRVFFEELELSEPAFNLGIGSGSHAVQTAGMLVGLEEAMQRERPDWVLIYGDTNSTLAGALAASKLHIPIAHVEAGLRSFNRRMPEEINRIVADALSDLLFAPTETSAAQLRSEGVESGRIRVVGDVMYDAVLQHAARAERRSRVLENLAIRPGGYALATVHRAENTDNADRLRVILGALARLGQEMPVVLPLHPRTRAAMDRHEIDLRENTGVRIIDPVGYLDMLRLESNAGLVATDSGGVQKEAFFFRVPCVTLREETEWVELVDLGWNRLCPPADLEATWTCLRGALGTTGAEAAPYGSGDAGTKIAAMLSSLESGRV